MEFSAYNLLCVIMHSNNNRDLLSSMSRLVVFLILIYVSDFFLDFLNYVNYSSCYEYWRRISYYFCFPDCLMKQRKIKLFNMHLQFVQRWLQEIMLCSSDYTKLHLTWTPALWVSVYYRAISMLITNYIYQSEC